MFNVPGAIVTRDVDHEMITGANWVRAGGGNYLKFTEMTIAGNSKLIIALLNFLKIAPNNVSWERIWLK